MPFLPPNQQCQSTEGLLEIQMIAAKYLQARSSSDHQTDSIKAFREIEFNIPCYGRFITN